MPSAGMEDALGLVADCCHFLAFAALLFKLCVFARSDQQKERACRDVSLKTQVGLTAAYALRYMDLWRKPKRSLEPLLKYASKLPSWRKLSAANLVAPELTISEDSSRILMISPREHRVYSRWDKTNHRALSPYGRAMADAVRAHALPPLQRARVLMLGLGGGVIPGDLLCNPAADVAAVTAVEAFPGVARLAEARFFPAIFSGACKGMRDRLTVVVGDALAGGLDAVKASGPRFSSILVDIPG